MNENEKLDRNVRIERQAAMHFASRIVSSRMDESWDDEMLKEELNKWMRKFQRGVHTGQIP